ncbi:MAG: nickel insertion protein [bacterium]|nr:nickel insertion protein [bacterium]
METEHTDANLLELSANIDDMSPELCAPVLDQLLAAGAKDAWFQPILMKKGRPALMLKCLLPAKLLETIEGIVFNETSSMGLRYHAVTGHRLEKSLVTVATPWGEVQVKIAKHQGKTTQVSPEFEDCKQLAEQAQVPLKLVFEAARRAADSLK